MKFSNSNFIRITTSSGQKMIQTINAAFSAEECIFESNQFYNSMIYCQDAEFSLFFNTITNCYIPDYSSGDSKAVIHDHSNQNYGKFQSNTITFSDTEHCRAFYFFTYTNLIWKYDTITNAKVPITERGSCAYFNSGNELYNHLELNGLTFSNCYGGSGSIISIDNLNDNYNNPERFLPFIIMNTTFKNIKNNNNYPADSGPVFLIQANYQDVNSGEVLIRNCTFKFIESDVVLGCTFGSSKDFPITYEDTVFDSIYFSGERNGGVLIFDENNNDKKLTVKNCLFKNISSKYGGCAIYYSTNTKELIVEDSDFIQCFATETSSSFGAIFINFQQNTSPAVIKGCSFDNMRANKGNAIYITQVTGSHQLTIDDCSFSDAGSTGFAIESSLINRLKIHSVSISFPENDNSQKCGGMLINCVGTIEISSCKFNNIKCEKSIYYKPNDYGYNIHSFIIDDCTFDHCDGECIFFDVMDDSFEVVTISHCNFLFVKNKNGDLPVNTIGFNQNSRSLDLNFDSNHFFNCGKDGYIMYFNFDVLGVSSQQIEFNSNEFIFDGTDGGCVALRLLSIERSLLINNCTFQRCLRNKAQDPWENTLSANNLNKIIIEKCEFIDCGPGNAGNIIALESGIKEATVQNCSFYCQDRNNGICGAAISIFTNFIKIIGNSFERCGENTIRYACQTSLDNQFEIIENHFHHLYSGTIIEVVSTMNNNPIFERNIFENIDINSNSMNIKIQELSNSILFNNNTFRNFKTKYGGVGGSIECDSNSILQLKFSKCYFLDNHQNIQGGGFAGSTSYNLGNVHLTLSECVFIKNEAMDFGGALSIETKDECTIENCEFTSNSINNHEYDWNDSKGGAIYITNPQTTISGCKFTDNQCLYGNAIYASGSIYVIINDNTEFNSNYNPNSNDEQFVIFAENNKNDIIDSKFNCENNIHQNLGCIYFTQPSFISIIRTKFQYLSSNSIILYSPSKGE